MKVLFNDIAIKCGADVSEGYGCDIYIEVTGNAASVKQESVISMCYRYFVIFRLQMICRQGTFVEYSVFGKETTTDWTVISDAKGI